MARLDEIGEPQLQPIRPSDESFEEDVELQGLSLYEKKAVLTNRELDRSGMGRYQWCIFLLCGFGYLIDLMWAQAFGLVVAPMQAELGFSDAETGNLASSFHAGLCAGAFVWGVLVDIVGRRWAFNLTCLISSAFGLGLGAPSDYNGVLVLAAFVGFGVGGNIPIDSTICLEFLPQNRRFLLALLSLFQPLGVVICSGIAYGFIPRYSCSSDLLPCGSVALGESCCTKDSNMGWRYTLYTIGAITLAVFLLRFVVFSFRESPKYLLYRGEDAKAIHVLEQVAKFNKTDCQLTLQDFKVLGDDDRSPRISEDLGPVPGAGGGKGRTSFSTKARLEFSRYKLFFDNRTIARITILVWIAYIFDYWAFSVAGFFLPKILLAKNKEINVSLEETYRNYVIIYLPGIIGVMLGALMYAVPTIGRKYGMVFSSTMMGVSLFIFSTVNTQASNIGLNVMEYFFQSMYNAILYGWTPEVFPAPIRGTACGIASFWGRLFSIISPIIAGHLLEHSLNGVLYLAGAAAFVSTAAILFIPTSRIGGQSY